MAGGSANGNGAPAGDGDGDEHQRFAYNQWKKHAPLLYDLLYNHNLTHPSPCVRWGHVISEDSTTTTQRIYYSERGASPNTIVVANVKINKIGMSDPLKMDKYDENNSCPSITEPLRIETPDRTEVNKIYTFQQNKNLIVAKSDLSQLHIFDVTQGSSRPAAMTLSGHSPDSCESNFALDTSSGSTRPRVVSGDKDGVILVWDISAELRGSSKDIAPTTRFEGHSATVEDVCFKPGSHTEVCSVGDDRRLLFWDERSGTNPVLEAPKWSSVDLHCVDWNPSDVNLLVTGTADGATFVFDHRKVSAPLHRLKQHDEAVFRVGWLPQSTSHFASGGDDGFLYLWDLSRVGMHQDADAAGNGPPEIIMKHAGHRGSVQDFQWNSHNPWVMASVSEDAMWASQGGTMQIWRPLDFVSRDPNDCLAQIDKLQSDIRGAIE